jgi:hypothetical protein
MPAKRKNAAAPAHAKNLEAALWDAANKMREAVPPPITGHEQDSTIRTDHSLN